MSTSKNHTLRYLFMIFPALAIVISKTISDWLSPDKKNQALLIMAVITATTVLFVNATPFQVKVTLRQNSKEIRELAAIIHINNLEKQKIGNYQLTGSNPHFAVLFYSNRALDPHIVAKPEILLEMIATTPTKTWLTSIQAFENLTAQHPDKLYLIQANSKYAFFTAIENQINISYDFSQMQLPLVK